MSAMSSGLNSPQRIGYIEKNNRNTIDSDFDDINEIFYSSEQISKQQYRTSYPLDQGSPTRTERTTSEALRNLEGNF